MQRTEVTRVLIADQRDNGSYLRASWHADRRVVVISHWRDDVCTATAAIGLSEIPGLISLLVGALADRAVPDAGAAGAVGAVGVTQPAARRLAQAWAETRRTLRRVLGRHAA